MVLEKISCPACGSGSVVPAEKGRVYCKSCDSLSERPNLYLPDTDSKPESNLYLADTNTPKVTLDTVVGVLAGIALYSILLVPLLVIAWSVLSTL